MAEIGFLHIISIWIIVLPLIAGIINYKRLNNDSRWILFIVIAGIVPQLLTFIINAETPALNISYNLYTPVEFTFLFALFYKKIKHLTHTKILHLSCLVYAVAVIFNFLQYGIADSFLNSLVCVNNIIYIIWILLSLRELYSSNSHFIQKNNPFCWYLLALLIYAPGSLIAFALYHYIRDPNDPSLMNLWMAQSVCNILMYLLFSIGLFIPKQKLVCVT